MALALPKRSQRGRGRPKRAKIPTAANVPQIKTQSDPGVNVPDFGKFTPDLSGIGEGFEAAGDAIAKADDKVKTRQEAIDRITLEIKLERFLDRTRKAFSAEGDFSSTDTQEAFGKSSREFMDELMTEHEGRPDSQARLRISLEKLNQTSYDKASILGAKASDAKAADAADGVVNTLAAQAEKGGDPNLLIAEGLEHMQPGSNLAETMRPGDELKFVQDLRQKVMSGSINNMFRSSRLDDVQRALEDPAFQDALGPELQRTFWDRLAKARAPQPMINVAQNTDLWDPNMNGGKGGIRHSNKPPTGAEEGDMKLAELERVLGRPPTMLERQRALGVDEKPSLVDMRTNEQSTFRQKMGEIDAKKLGEMEAQAHAAVFVKSEVTRMRAAIESMRFKTGPFYELRHFLARIADFTGMGAEIKKAIGDAATADTMDAAMNRLAIGIAQKMSRVTNMSLTFIIRSLPGLMRTPEGNLILMDVMDRVADRDIQIALLANQYAQENNSLRAEKGKSFFEISMDLENDDPLITEELRQRILDGGKAAPDSIKDDWHTGQGVGDEPVRRVGTKDLGSVPPGTTIWYIEGNRFITTLTEEEREAQGLKN